MWRFSEIESRLSSNLDSVIGMVEDWVKERMLPLDVLVNSSTDLLSQLLKDKLFNKGYRGKRGYTVDRRVFMKTYPYAKWLLRQRIYQALVNGEITSPDGVIDSINRIRRQVVDLDVRTIDKYLGLIKQEQQRSSEFETFLRIIMEVIEQSIRELE